MLFSSLSLIGVILFHILFFINIIPVEIFIGVTDLILISNISHYLWYKRRMKILPKKCRKAKVPARPKTPPRIKNKYLARWNRQNSKMSVLPLNRIAFLKARYHIGPYKSHKYGHEVSISFLKSQAEKPYFMQLQNDECHPKCYATQYSESYIQYRALLYLNQRVSNVHKKKQHTARFESQEQLDDNIQEQTTDVTTSLPARRYTLAPTTIEKDIQSIKQASENLKAREKWDEFEKEVEKSREYIKEVEWKFKLWKDQEKMDEKEI